MNTLRAGRVVGVWMGLVLAHSAAGVSIDLVPVGNPGNAADIEVMNDGTSGYGTVAYSFQMGKFEITARQYCDFLNAVARKDAYRLYDSRMPSQINEGCMILQNGTDGAYTYSVAADWADRPVNYMSWASAARFCNWLANGQPTGPQDLTTTEDGSYYLNGALTNERVLAVVRKPNATWVIPNENEWYKAAFHKNNGTTGDYWDYAMGSDAAPDNGNPGGDSGNSSNFYDGNFAIGAPYYVTPVGFFSRSPSPYGTHDQGGNVQEWNETLLLGAYRGLRGGAAHHAGSSYQRATWHSGTVWNNSRPDVGFRVALVPEPAAAALALASFALLTRRQRQ